MTIQPSIERNAAARNSGDRQQRARRSAEHEQRLLVRPARRRAPELAGAVEQAAVLVARGLPGHRADQAHVAACAAERRPGGEELALQQRHERIDRDHGERDRRPADDREPTALTWRLARDEDHERDQGARSRSPSTGTAIPIESALSHTKLEVPRGVGRGGVEAEQGSRTSRRCRAGSAGGSGCRRSTGRTRRLCQQPPPRGDGPRIPPPDVRRRAWGSTPPAGRA